MKIKIFMWYINRRVILTKDNLAKWNLQGNKQCCFCHKDETIQHLFLDCQYARLVWGTVYAAWGLPRPHNVSNLFGSWLDGLRKDLKPLVLLGAGALCSSCGSIEMQLYLKTKNLPFCRSFTQLHTSSVHGPSYRSLLSRRWL